MVECGNAPCKLLVIDDNPESLRMIEDMLSSEGLEILTAGDPETGLKIFFQQRPPIVLVDLVMPSMGGIQVLETILAADPIIEVILMTAFYSAESAVEAIQKGASNYLTKPIDLEKLRAQIERIRADARLRQRTAELTGVIALSGDSNIQVSGIFTLLGAPHEITVPMLVHLGGASATAKGHFVVPYVQWGLKNPSFLIWKADDDVAIDLNLVGTLSK